MAECGVFSPLANVQMLEQEEELQPQTLLFQPFKLR